MSFDWQDDRACRGEDTDLFFGDKEERDRALAICGRCSVRPECRADAIAHGDIVGGFTTHGQVVGGCGPYKAPKGVTEPMMLPCLRDECMRMFNKRRGPGANLYCSPECSAAARKASRTRQRRRAS